MLASSTWRPAPCSRRTAADARSMASRDSQSSGTVARLRDAPGENDHRAGHQGVEDEFGRDDVFKQLWVWRIGLGRSGPAIG
jgi:hypothetical protein